MVVRSVSCAPSRALRRNHNTAQPAYSANSSLMQVQYICHNYYTSLPRQSDGLLKDLCLFEGLVMRIYNISSNGVAMIFSGVAPVDETGATS